MLKKVKSLPVGAAVAFLIVCILAGLLLGNLNATKSVRAACSDSFQPVLEIAGELSGEASNLAVLAERYGLPSAGEINAVKAKLQNAKTPSALSAAVEDLTSVEASVSAQMNAADNVSDNDRANLQAILDDLQSLKNVLGHQADTYNEAVAKAKEVYRKLPMRFLLGSGPEAYQ